MKPAKLYTVEVTEEGEDLVIEFPEEIVQEQGWVLLVKNWSKFFAAIGR